MILETLRNGAALGRFERMLVTQNVQPDIAHQLCHGDAHQVLGRSKFSTPLLAFSSGYVTDLDALAIAQVCGALGAARARASDVILSNVGLRLHVKVGYPVEAGQPWAELHHECPEVVEDLWRKLQNSLEIGATSANPDGQISSRILETIQ